MTFHPFNNSTSFITVYYLDYQDMAFKETLTLNIAANIPLYDILDNLFKTSTKLNVNIVSLINTFSIGTSPNVYKLFF